MNELPKIGSRVRTTKGCRINGPSSGKVVGYGWWREYQGVRVLKDSDGTTRLFLLKNLVEVLQMIEFKLSEAKTTLRVIPVGAEFAIGHIWLDEKEKRFRPLEKSFSGEELRQIADKLTQLNEDKS